MAGDPAAPREIRLPLFPLHAVLFPGGVLPLRVFEQRYVEMVKACLRDETPFGVCRIVAGSEVVPPGADVVASAPQFAPFGTLARIREWDMPQLGILHVQVEGTERFTVTAHEVQGDGLVTGSVRTLPAEPAHALPEAFAPLAELLQLLATRIGPQQFPATRRLDDASWVGYRLAELLPLPLSIKQSMLEINDADVRLAVLARFLREQKLL
jgi:Lon protease-like protein